MSSKTTNTICLVVIAVAGLLLFFMSYMVYAEEETSNPDDVCKPYVLNMMKTTRLSERVVADTVSKVSQREQQSVTWDEYHALMKLHSDISINAAMFIGCMNKSREIKPEPEGETLEF